MSVTPKVLEGYCPLPDARLSHLRKPRSINVHGKQLYLCQYTGELSPKAYGVTIYGVRQGCFKDIGCLFSFLVSVINGPKAEVKEKKEAWELYGELIRTLSLENGPVPVAGSPLELERFGGTLFRLDDKYTYHIPEMEAEMEKKWLFDPNVHTEHEIKPKEPRMEIQCPLGFTNDYFVIDYKEATLLTLRTQLASFFEENQELVHNSYVAFKHTPDAGQSEFALVLVSENNQEAKFIVRPYTPIAPIRKRAPRPKRTQETTKEEKIERRKQLKKMDKENEKTIVADILRDSAQSRSTLEEGEIKEEPVNIPQLKPAPQKRIRVAREKVLQIAKEMDETIEKKKQPRPKKTKN